MKRNIYLLITIVLLTIVGGGCQDPETLMPSVARLGLNSITATFEDGTGEFIGINAEGKNEIIIPIPYYYPENSDHQMSMNDVVRMRVEANLDDNVTIEPAILYMDLTKENVITVTDQRKQKKQYVVKGQIVKSNACLLEEFNLPSLGLSGIINQEAKTISLIAVGNIEPALATIRLSYHATISPDPTVAKLDYNSDLQLTVTAHDGVSNTVYTVKKEQPGKLPFGIRTGSGKLMFAKKLQADLGIAALNLTGGIAVSGDYLVINTRNENSIYINAKTGAMAGTIELGAVKGGLMNFYNTADKSGNILICNLAPNAGDFKVWKLNGVTGSPQEYINWNTGGKAVGRKLSVQGSLDGSAIITAPLVPGVATTQFARWTVVGGVLTSQTPEIVTVSGVSGWTTHVDVVYTSATDVNSDYFIACYTANTCVWVDGTTNVVRKKINQLPSNYIVNNVDYVEFNKAKYMTFNWLNPWNWGDADRVFLLNVSIDADYANPVVGEWGHNAVPPHPYMIWGCDMSIYGSKGFSGPANTNATGDVALSVSPDGYYLYLYFMFTNGYVVGYQFDCVDQ